VRWAALKRADRELADVNVLNTAESNQLRGRPRMRDRSVY
jgi:hypothetical protein